MEFEARRFYERAMARTSDAGIRKLLGDLAEAERSHIIAGAAARRRAPHRRTREQAEEETRAAHVRAAGVQPGLAGLMDGSVSTLAPLFAAAFATARQLGDVPGRHGRLGRRRHLHGLRRGAVRRRQLTGRGHPWLRGAVCGPDDHARRHRPHAALPDPGLPRSATTLAIAVVLVELWAIAWIRSRYMDTPFLRAAFQVVVGGLLVFAAGILIGSA